MHYLEDPGNAYYTHAMVYSPGIVLFRDDRGEWRSPVEVDVLTSAAVNAGEIKREVERKEILRRERVTMEYWKKRREEMRKESEEAAADRRRLREEAKYRKEKEETAKLKKEHAGLKLKKEMAKNKETDKGKGKYSGGEKAELFVANEKMVEVEKSEGSQKNTIDSPESGLGCGSDSQLKGTEEDDLFQPDAPPEVIQESTSSSSIVHPLSPPTQPSQSPGPDSDTTYAFALKNAEIQIQHTMYTRISRILHLFQLHKTPYIILGSFGTGVFKNSIELIASIFADLLIKPGGRFKDVFQMVVFAILGKETARVFTEIFSRVDKQGQRGGTGNTCVFKDWYGNDGDVKEGDEEKRMRMMRWESRRRKRRKTLMNVIPDVADATSFHSAQVDAAAQASAVPYPTSSSAAGATYPPSSDAASSRTARPSVTSCPPSFDTQASAVPYPAFSAAQADAANRPATDYYAFPENAKMISTRDDEQVDFVAKASANTPITVKATVETESVTTGSRETQKRSNNKGDGGDEIDESVRLRDIAQGTIKAINDGYVDFLDSNMLLTRCNIRKSADSTVRKTKYFEPDTPWLGLWWKGPLIGVAARQGKQSGVAVQILKMSTLQGADFLAHKYPASKTGVLNFASATKPGGGFINGASAQEESIARSSTLYLSLEARQATPFYELHRQDNGGGFYSHSMIYSPSVTIFRKDNGDWRCPYYVDIVTSPAVAAGLVRKRLPDTEIWILSVMRERMGRMLALFEQLGIKNLVLGSFGTGVLQNDVSSLAKIWGEILGAPGARFANSFDQVVFAIPDSDTLQKFGTGFNVAANPPRRHPELSGDTKSSFTNKDSKLTPHSHEAQNSESNKKDNAIDLNRIRLQNIARGTVQAIKDGYVDFADSNMRFTRHYIRQSADDTVRGTVYFGPGTPWLHCWWQGPPLGVAERHGNLTVQILKMSALQGARRRPASKIGLLNFASAVKPGGEFMNGANAQEESIARSSTLYLSLESHLATPFYELHTRDNRGGFYSHAMIYSPSVAIFRDDNGDWLCPYHVDIVTCPAVNAGLVRKLRLPYTEGKILSEMKERMGRILALFERSGIRNLVLGSFGTGVFQNDIGSLAKIWGELLVAPGSRFAHSFDEVIFAIPDSYTFQIFEMGFNAGANPHQIWHPQM